MPTTSDVIAAFAYYIGSGGYYEKASAKNLSREVSDFAANKGSANYTYMGKLCGVNPGAWCAMMVSTAVYEACGSDKAAAREAMWGVWPYTSCNQLFDAGLAHDASHYSPWQLTAKGRTGEAYMPQAGDVIVFSDNGTTRTHTGLVYAVDSATVYTYEGNSGNMARKRSYALTSSYIYGYVTLNLTGETPDTDDGADASGIAQFQRWLDVSADGVYGPETKAAAVKAHQRYVNAAYGAGIAEDGVWGPDTYYATERVQRPDDTDDVTVWQGLLYCLGYDPVGLDGSFGANTESATMELQNDKGLNATGIADAYTWARALGSGRPAHTVLKKGSAGQEVRYLQRLLTEQGHTLQTDGKFGSKTRAAVLEYQTAQGLDADGIVGPLTWAAIE
ncbi:MAG: peptidoglycan-binding protein [Oscillospiraceae bacterium]|nr:peptidoglycan-binding protein [Oscillospiraceae bacterium]